MQNRIGQPELIRLAEWITFGCVSLLYFQLNSNIWVISPDSTDYVEGARALAAFRGFLDTTGEPITFFPPGAGAVYALAALVPSETYWYFNLVTKLLVLAFLALTFLVIRRSAGRGAALITVCFLALSTALLTESTRILSDIPFSAIFMLTLWQFPPERLEGLGTRQALLLGGLISYCYLIRTVGLFAYLGYAAYITFCVRSHRTRTLVVVSVVFLTVAVLMGFRASSLGHGPSYLQLLGSQSMWVDDSAPASLPVVLRRALNFLQVTLADVYAVAANTDRLRLSGLTLCVLLSLGLGAGGLRRQHLLHTFLLAACLSAFVLMGSAQRYVIPVAPLLALFVVEGARWLGSRVSDERSRRELKVLLVALICVSPYWQDGYRLATQLRAPLNVAGDGVVLYRGHEAFIELARANSHRVSRVDVIATMHANVLRYFVPDDVTVRNLPITNDVGKGYQAIKAIGATYLYCDTRETGMWSRTLAVITTYASSFELVAENTGGRIYRLVP